MLFELKETPNSGVSGVHREVCCLSEFAPDAVGALDREGPTADVYLLQLISIY